MKRDGWEVKKLEDVGIVVTGNTPKTSIAENYDSEDICFVKPSDISNEGISLVSTTDNYISEFARGQARILPIGSVLVTCIGIIGKTAVLEKEAATNQQINSVIPSENIINKFLAYALLAARDTLNHMSNAPVVPIINKTQFSSLSIPVPPLPIQKQIVKELDTLSDIIAKKKEQLAELDTLAQTTFYDMFGDPVDNEKGWEKGFVKDTVSSVNYGTSSPATQNGRFKYLRMNNITYSGFLDLTNIKYIDIEEKNVYKYIVQKGDLLFNRTNSKELVGKTAVFTKDEQMIIAGYLIRVRTNPKFNSFYIWGHLNSAYGKAYLRNLCKSIIGMANINAKELQSIPILLPPLPLQNQFATRIEAIEKQKELINRSIVDVQLLFDYTMDKYFN